MVATTEALTPYQVQRYSRHIIMPQVGSAGQRKMLDAKVLVIGAGGLGSPVSIYLALAGVGTLGIVDFDTVDITNLQRQLLHHNADVGRRKVESATDTLKAYNPDVVVVPHEEPLTSENAMGIMTDYDVIVNGADNFPARYLVNDAAYLNNKPLVDGSILIFDGMASVFLPGEGCYRCLFPEPPPPGEVPSCAEAGVLGMLPRAGRIDPGDRDSQAHHGHRGVAVRASAAHRRAGHGLSYRQASPQSGMSAVRRQPDGHGADRLRGILRNARGGIVESRRGARLCARSRGDEQADAPREVRDLRPAGRLYDGGVGSCTPLCKGGLGGI